ncbi:MAG: Ig-like domain-containing protein [Bacteroidales bacterium]|nr:Ig-like domain-containing protein [Bacteroidales bacterium]
MKKIGYILLSAIALLTLACKKTEEEKPQPKPEAPKIEIPSESQAVFSQGISIEAGTAAQSKTVKFTTNQAWSADVADVKASTWLSVQPTSGSAGTVTMTVTAQVNPGKEAREASVTIKCGTASKKFTVKQAGIPAVEVTSVTLDKTEVGLVEGETAQLTATVAPDNATDKTVTWSSDKAEVATVDNTGKVTAVKEGKATITAKAGSKEATCVVTVTKKVVPVTEITLSKETLELTKGQSETLTATVLPADATDPSVTWTTSDASIATVEGGKVTAVKSGSATITAKAGEKEATCKVTVTTPVESITLDSSTITLEEGKSTTLTATVLPADADDKTVTWTSSDASVATVSGGKVTAVKEGSATITAKAGDKTATCAVTVMKQVIAVTGITLNKTSLELNKGQSETLSAMVTPDNATDKTVNWTSSQPEVATVDANGKITAVSAGSAVIKAKAGEKEATCAVTVKVPVETVTLDKTTLTLEEGKEVTLTATVTPADASDPKVTWSSSASDIATVDANGKVKAVKEGKATITATAGGKSATCAVTVTKAPVPATSVTLNKSTLELYEGKTETLTATVAPANTTDELTWSSDKTAVATVDNTGKVTAVAEGTAVITAKAGDKSATCTVTVKKVVAVTSLTLNKTTLELEKGASETLTVTVTPENATDKSVTWSTDKADVATVDNTGKVTAVGGGSATITVKSANGKTATCAVTVKVPVTAVKLNKAELDLNVGTSETLTVSFEPADATDKTVTWESSKKEVATVDENGKVTAVTKGEATITVKSANGKTATCAVTVKVPVTSVTLDKSSLEMSKGEEVTLNATVAPDDASDPKVTWSTSDSAVATVDQTGKVKAVGGGTATITAKAGDKSATCAVTVKVPATGITLNKPEITLDKGASETLVATVAPADATDKTVTWESTKDDIATVDQTGKVTAVAKGEATIKAKIGDFEATCKVTVTIPVTGVTLNKSTLTLVKGTSETLEATVAPDDANNKSVTWSSNKTGVATVDENGKVTAVDGGEATITVTTANGKTATCEVTVTVPVESVTLDHSSLDLEVGDTAQLTATVNPSNATNKKVTWSSGDNSIAKVDETGKVTATGVGSITITVTTEDGGKKATCTVTVKAAATDNTEGYGSGTGEWNS